MTNEIEKKKPALNIFVRIPQSDGDTRLSKTGIAWKHGQGEGYNIILDAQPIPHNGQIDLVAFPPKD